jgi:hypothetical protein
MPKITIPANGWRPRPYQMPAWAAWERGIKRSLLVWHRRAGKDELSLQKFACAAMTNPANYWHCLPKYEQARKAIWEAVNPHTGRKRIDEVFPMEIRKRTDNSSMVVEFKTGSVYRVVGSDNPDSLVGAPPLGIAFSEWAISNPSAWGLLQPILLENGGWADFITTPRGRNHVHGMLKMARARPETWFSQVLTVDDTHQVTPEMIAEAKAEYVSLFGEDAAEALIQQEYWCSFEAAILGSYYGKELAQAEQQGRIGDVEPTAGVAVHVAWDLGVGDDNPLWFWQAVPGAAGRGQIKILDYYTAHGYGIKHYADVVKRRIEQWNDELGDIRLGINYVPHDAKVREQGSWDSDTLKAKQRIEVMAEQFGASHVKVVKAHSIQDGISAVRQILHRCWFDEARCSAGLEALRQYQSEWDDKKKKFRDEPLHDWTSHPADAFRYLAMAYREIVPPEPAPDPRALVVGAAPALPEGYRGVSLEDLWRSARQRKSRRM